MCTCNYWYIVLLQVIPKRMLVIIWRSWLQTFDSLYLLKLTGILICRNTTLILLEILLCRIVGTCTFTCRRHTCMCKLMCLMDAVQEVWTLSSLTHRMSPISLLGLGTLWGMAYDGLSYVLPEGLKKWMEVKRLVPWMDYKLWRWKHWLQMMLTILLWIKVDFVCGCVFQVCLFLLQSLLPGMDNTLSCYISYHILMEQPEAEMGLGHQFCKMWFVLTYSSLIGYSHHTVCDIIHHL